ncbi:MAG: hypothetical protein DKT66_16770 [Candidatus Melainabacteria bacterium]|nr:MAG: hypothetical protein DKT66_16770 [Candidatus Melainabacteria bacterium]
MKNIYDRLTELLNEPDYGPLFCQWLEDLNEGPYIETAGPTDQELLLYFFRRHGIRLKALADKGLPRRFFQIALYIHSNEVEGGYCGAFSGELPYNVESGDPIDVVRKKFDAAGNTPMDTGYLHTDSVTKLHYGLWPLQISFSFKNADGQMHIVHLTHFGKPSEI